MPDYSKKDLKGAIRMNLTTLEILFRYVIDGKRLQIAAPLMDHKINELLEQMEKVLIGTGYMTEAEVRRIRHGPTIVMRH